MTSTRIIQGNGKPKLVKALLNSLHVGDMTSGESTVERGFDLFVNSRKIMAEGGLNLRKWQSNSPQLRCLMQGCNELAEHEASHQIIRAVSEKSANRRFLELIGITLKTV